MRRLAMTALSLGVLFLFSATGFSQDCTEPGSILSAKNTRQGNFEYVVFRMKLPLNSGFTRTVTTVTPPFVEDPSGNPVTVAGSKFKKIRFTSVVWMCSIKEQFSLPKAVIKGIESTGQFEGIVEYVVGYGSYSRYVSTYHYDTGSIRRVVMWFRR